VIAISSRRVFFQKSEDRFSCSKSHIVIMAQSPVSTSPSYFDPTPHFALPVAGVLWTPPRLTSKLLLYSLQAELMDIDRPQSDSEVSLASVQQSGAVNGNDKTIRNGNRTLTVITYSILHSMMIVERVWTYSRCKLIRKYWLSDFCLQKINPWPFTIFQDGAYMDKKERIKHQKKQFADTAKRLNESKVR
jgi:hypothetical protein